MSEPGAFERGYGFRRDAVTLATWRTAPFNRWSFQNVEELVPSALIAHAGAGDTMPTDIGGLLGQTVSVGGQAQTVGAFLARSDTDALVVMKGGKIVGDYAAPQMAFGNRHIIFSISKSVTAILAGIVEADGLLDPDAPVIEYVPEAETSAWGDATVRHVLDMTVALDIEEAYTDPNSAYGRYRKATLWNPGGGEESLPAFLLTLPKLAGEDHGHTFRYRSPNSDMLGLIVERAAGVRIPDLMREKLWKPLGARADAAITVDGIGTARTAGGLSTTARDLARLGEMMRRGGEIDGRRIVPEAWVRDTIASGGDAGAWKRGAMAFLFPAGRYRSKWYQTGTGGFCGIGIHGQWLYVDPTSEVVIAKQSSQPEPVDDALDIECVAFFEALCRMV